MIGLISKLFGGNKSEKDIKKVMPVVESTLKFYESFNTLTNDELRSKTQEFKNRIKDYLKDIDAEINTKKEQADTLPIEDITAKDIIYKEIDSLKKDRDKKIEEILKELQPEAFAVVKETSRRFKENAEVGFYCNRVR
jgi:preprotein translocase subunit SecA